MQIMSEFFDAGNENSGRKEDIRNDGIQKPHSVVIILLCLFLLVVLLSGVILGDTELSPDPQLNFPNIGAVESARPDSANK